MRLVLVLWFASLMLVGCQAKEPGVQRTARPAASASVEESSGASLPATVPSLSREDATRRTPEDAVKALVAAANSRDWETLYSLYATPTPNLDNATREWVEARERYDALLIREVRVVSPDLAYVRLTYRLTTTPMGSSAYSVVVSEPGEWWPVRKVAGRWKTQWMPRQ